MVQRKGNLSYHTTNYFVSYRTTNYFVSYAGKESLGKIQPIDGFQKKQLLRRLRMKTLLHHRLHMKTLLFHLLHKNEQFAS
jgi:hypothetical protein